MATKTDSSIGHVTDIHLDSRMEVYGKCEASVIEVKENCPPKKNLDKITSGELLPRYPDVDWKKAKGMRDILIHHYSDINAEAVFFTCQDKIPKHPQGGADPEPEGKRSPIQLTSRVPAIAHWVIFMYIIF